MFKLLYAGFDRLDIAFQGALPKAKLDFLKHEKERAQEGQEPVLVKIGPGNVPLMIGPGGMSGGYAFVADAGPLFGHWRFKANADPRQWNIFVSPSAAGLAALGYHAMRDGIVERLRDIGATITGHSVNRVDFAMDFLTQGFELHLNNFVAHPNCKEAPHWGENAPPGDPNQPSAVFRGRSLESVTIGKMPGRQVIVYDKRRAAIALHKPFWFKVWDIDRKDATKEVWRVELRAGKKELKDRWAIRTLEDVENSIGDVMANALTEVRYLDDHQTDSNVSRQRPHALWQAAEEALGRSLTEYRSGLTPGQLLEIERDQALRNYAQLIIGNAIGYGVVAGLSNEEIFERLPDLLRDLAHSALIDTEDKIAQSINRARERMAFILSEETA